MSEEVNKIMPRLEVKALDFGQACKTLRTFIKRKARDDAVFSFGDDRLRIDVAGMTVTVPGEGRLCGQACISWPALRPIVMVPPTEEPLVFQFEDRLLWIGSSAVPCVWQGTLTEVIELPMDPTMPMVLALPRNYTEEQIARSGLTGVVWDAEAQMHDLIGQATATLAPLGVSRSGVERIVEEVLEEYSQKRREKVD